MVALPTLVGFTGFGGSNTDPATPLPFTLDIPAGAEFGDLLVASMMTQGSIEGPGRGLTELYHEDTFWAFGVYAGFWDGDTTPIAWEGTGFNNAVGQFFAAFLACFRDGLDETRPLAHALGPTVPGLPGEGPALSVNWVRSGVGGVAGFAPYQGTDWTELIFVDGTYVRGTVAVHGDTVADQTATGAFGFDTGGPYMSFGLDGLIGAPPCRLHPREDARGVGSGRIWPPPKSQQASSRRAGGYY